MISVVMATHNEEQNLERCLHSVKSFADEVIIVDGESTDGTVALAKKLGARVTSTTNKANFHINKQMAIDEAKGEVILQMDADEEVDAELAKFITNLEKQKAYQNQSKDQPVAWWLRRKNLFLGKFLTKGGQYPDPVIRLFYKGKARLPQKDVHEQMQVDGEVGWAEGHLIHYSNPTFSDYMRKFNTYTSFKAQQLKDAGIKPSVKNGFIHLIWKPKMTFFSLYFRHKGFVDGIPGFVFALFSALHHVVAYIKLQELHDQRPD